MLVVLDLCFILVRFARIRFLINSVVMRLVLLVCVLGCICLIRSLLFTAVFVYLVCLLFVLLIVGFSLLVVLVFGLLHVV